LFTQFFNVVNEINAQTFKLLSRALYEVPVYERACISTSKILSNAMAHPLIDKLPPSLQHTLIPLMETLFKEQERFFSEMQHIHNTEASQYIQQLETLQHQFENSSLEEQHFLLNQLQSAISSQLHYLLLQSLVSFLLFSHLSSQKE
jgi:hypothetical protein